MRDDVVVVDFKVVNIIFKDPNRTGTVWNDHGVGAGKGYFRVCLGERLVDVLLFQGFDQIPVGLYLIPFQQVILQACGKDEQHRSILLAYILRELHTAHGRELDIQKSKVIMRLVLPMK